jgi:hypothetical protein
VLRYYAPPLWPPAFPALRPVVPSAARCLPGQRAGDAPGAGGRRPAGHPRRSPRRRARPVPSPAWGSTSPC